MHCPGIGPGPPPWQGEILPLDQQCFQYSCRKIVFHQSEKRLNEILQQKQNRILFQYIMINLNPVFYEIATNVSYKEKALSFSLMQQILYISTLKFFFFFINSSSPLKKSNYKCYFS